MAEQPIPTVLDVAPGAAKRSIILPAIFAVLVTGFAFLLFQMLDINFVAVVAAQLFLVVFAVDIVTPIILSYVKFGRVARWYPIIIATFEAILAVVLLAALLVYQGIWVSSTGGLSVEILATTASLTIGVATFIISFAVYNWRISL